MLQSGEEICKHVCGPSLQGDIPKLSIGPVAQATSAASCTTTATLQAIGDLQPDAAPAADGEDDVVAPPATTPELEGRGDSKDATKQTMETIVPIGDVHTVEENLEPTVEDREKEERGN